MGDGHSAAGLVGTWGWMPEPGAISRAALPLLFSPIGPFSGSHEPAVICGRVLIPLVQTPLP